MGKLHISAGLFFLLSHDSAHLSIFINHLLNNCINLLFFLNVFGVGFGADLFLLSDLVLDLVLVLNKGADLGLVQGALGLVIRLLLL